MAELVRLYCETQECKPEDLRERLRVQTLEYKPLGFMLLRCAQMDSSYFASRTILPFGPSNTFKSIPDRPISPRGLAGDMSVVECWCEPEDPNVPIAG